MPGTGTLTLITENGWPQCSRDECDTALVPGTDHVRPELLAGDVDTVLSGWAAWFNRNVRPVEPADGHRNWWGWSATNDVWNSNHLSGTALDLCADELPWKQYTMPQDQVDTVHRGLALFEGNVYWGWDWGAGQQDEMHFQCGYNTWKNPQFAEFAQRLRDGYLNIYGPPDPLAFPLPMGYYYGPLDGPDNCISGDYPTDSQGAKEGLGRWQAKLGLPVTKDWDDATAKAATEMQHEKGWPPNPAFGYGGVYLAEWNAVMRDGWQLPKGWDPSKVPAPEIPLVKWGDYSQYQGRSVDDFYPYPGNPRHSPKKTGLCSSRCASCSSSTWPRPKNSPRLRVTDARRGQPRGQGPPGPPEGPASKPRNGPVARRKQRRNPPAGPGQKPLCPSEPG